MKLNNKHIWITGASSGIGKELAIQLSKKGAKIALTARNLKKLDEVLNMLDGEGHKIFVCDLMQNNTISKVTHDVLDWCNNSLDILVNNAGKTIRSFIVDTHLSVDRDIMELDYFAHITVTKTILPFMLKKNTGMIVSISSVAGKIGTPMRSSYNAAKHAIIGFMDSLRAEQHQNNIKVLNVLPGSINTSISINALEGDGSLHNKMDVAIENGLDVSIAVKKIVSSIEKEKNEVIVANFKETFAVYLKRFFPEILFKMISKVKTT